MGKVKEYLKERLTVILIFLFLVFIWPTPFETANKPGLILYDQKGTQKVWRFTGTPAPWE